MQKKKIIFAFLMIFIMSILFSIQVFGYISPQKTYDLNDLLNEVSCDKSTVEINNLDSNISKYQEEEIFNQILAYEEQLDELENNSIYSKEQKEKQQKNIQKQIISLQYQLNNLKSQNNLLQTKIDQQTQLAKYKFQTEYYNGALYFAQQIVEKANNEYLKKNLEVEKEKLVLGETTQISIDLLNNKLQLSENKLQMLNDSINTSKQAMLIFLEEYDLSAYNLNMDFNLSKLYLPEYKYSINEIQENFCSNNLNLMVLDYTIKNKEKQAEQLLNFYGSNDISYKIILAEVKKNKIQKEISEENNKNLADIYDMYQDYSSTY